MALHDVARSRNAELTIDEQGHQEMARTPIARRAPFLSASLRRRLDDLDSLPVGDQLAHAAALVLTEVVRESEPEYRANLERARRVARETEQDRRAIRRMEAHLGEDSPAVADFRFAVEDNAIVDYDFETVEEEIDEDLVKSIQNIPLDELRREYEEQRARVGATLDTDARVVAAAFTAGRRLRIAEAIQAGKLSAGGTYQTVRAVPLRPEAWETRGGVKEWLAIPAHLVAKLTSHPHNRTIDEACLMVAAAFADFWRERRSDPRWVLSAKHVASLTEGVDLDSEELEERLALRFGKAHQKLRRLSLN